MSKNNGIDSYSIGFDLSLNSCGIAVIDTKTKKLFRGDVYYFVKRQMDFDTLLECKQLVQRIFDWFPSKTNIEINVYIEMGNFGNPRTTQKFANLAGILLGAFGAVFEMNKYNKIMLNDFKVISPNGWFKEFSSDKLKNIEKSWAELTRAERKEYSKKYSGIRQDDLADAYWLAYYGKDAKGYYDE